MCETADLDDSDLLSAFARQGSESAFRCLVERHSPWVYASAYRQLRDAHLAEDATQAVFVLLFQRAGKMRLQQKLSGWLFLTLGYTVRSILRSQRRRRRHEKLAAMARPTRTPEPVLAADLDTAVARLREDDRLAILLRFYQGLGFESVGRRMGTSEDAAKKRVARALGRLRQRLGADATNENLTAASTFGAPLAARALIARITQIASGGAPISPGVGSAMKGVGYLVVTAKGKIVATVAILLLLMGTAAAVGVWVVLTPRSTPAVAMTPLPIPQTHPATALEQAYGLRPGELVRYVPRPFPPARKQIYALAGFTKAPLAMVIFWWNGKPGIKAFMDGDDTPDAGHTVQSLARILLGNWSRNIEGQQDLKNTIIPGDFVFQAGARPQELAPALAKVISKTTGRKISLTLRMVQRPVSVFTGKWHPTTRVITFDGQKPATALNSHGGGPVNFMADDLGEYIGQTVAIEATALPPSVDWSVDYVGIEPHDRDTVCRSFQEQTGLICHIETRWVQRLFIEQQK